MDDLKTRAELTNYEETSLYSEVMAFINELARRSGGLLRIESFGRTEEGREMPLMIFGSPDPSRPTVFVMANIHAGEVEGKEAMLAMSRRLVSGDLRNLLDKLFLLVAPIYNADGNERISTANRSEQFGPVGGVGTRENAKGLDLNRDYMKLEAAEARALVSLLNRWNPHLTVDLHTTNGSYHGYDLTFSPTLNPNAPASLIAYMRETMLPSVSRALSAHHFRSYFYGNFAKQEAFDDEISDPSNESGLVWRTFDHRPRFGNNYVGLRDRLTILSEAYSYLDFKKRIEVTAAFVEEILRYTALHSADIVALLDHVELPHDPGVAFELSALTDDVEILTGGVEKRVNQRSGLEMFAVLPNHVRPVRMKDYGTFRITRRVELPAAYIIPSPTTEVLEKLDVHGVATKKLRREETLQVDRFVVDDMQHSEKVFQGHREVRVRGHVQRESVTFQANALSVSTAQPLGRLVFYLLDPESDDGFVTWGFLNPEGVFRVPR